MLTTSDAKNGALSKTSLKSPADVAGITVKYSGARVLGITFSATATVLNATNVTNAVLTPGLSYKVVYRFHGGADGSYPIGLTFLNGTIYGTTTDDGPGGGAAGTVFSLSASGTKQVLYRFNGATDGRIPNGNLISMNGELYGTTFLGGTSNHGTIFALSTTGTERIVYNFQGGTDGASPEAGLLEAGGELYGVTTFGGFDDGGTVFEISPAGNERVLYRFKGGSDGARPVGRLIDVNGVLYGTTSRGGTNNAGTVFSVTTAGAESVLHRCSYGTTDGAVPMAGLVDLGGELYGTTLDAGPLNGPFSPGTVFKTGGSGAESVVHTFGIGMDGYQPVSDLIDANGTLFGTTLTSNAHFGSPPGFGTIFALDSATGAYLQLYTFQSAVGYPGGNGLTGAGLVDVNGVLYGSATGGGDGGNGIIFTLTP
jgi:uncharacterized repeat protein (TIGR03803 family)